MASLRSCLILAAGLPLAEVIKKPIDLEFDSDDETEFTYAFFSNSELDCYSGFFST